MKYELKNMTAQQLIDLTVQTKLNPNPIGQRPPTTVGPKKSVSIVESIINGYGCGMITVRDIRNNPEAQKLYGNAEYLVIDGGHRIRALLAFYMGKLVVNGKKYLDMDDFDLSSIIVPVDIRECDAHEATELFRKINTTTPVNFMEMVMSDEESEVCQFIRTQTMNVKEYGNDTHPLFDYKMNSRGDWEVGHFNTAPNPRRKWDEYVAIALIRALGGGLVDAGQPEIEKVAANHPPLTEVGKKAVIKFLNDARDLRTSKFMSNKFNTDTFSAFLVYWFGIYGENRNFSVKDKSFYKDFMVTYSKLTGMGNEVATETIEYEGERYFLKEFVRKNIKNFSNSEVQQVVYGIFKQYANGDGILFRDSKRSLSSSESESLLAAQGFVCAIDGLPLELKDAVFAHDTAWSKGGKSELDNGAIIRANHNRDMGTTTLEEYRLLLQMRGEI
jgi:hypothetical protein